jgi:hypothetical protein
MSGMYFLSCFYVDVVENRIVSYEKYLFVDDIPVVGFGGICSRSGCATQTHCACG